MPTKVRFVQDGKPAKEIEVDSPKLTINEVFISNASLNRAVTLRIALSITDSRGSTHKLSGEGKNRWGALLGQDDVETVSSRLRGQQPPPRVVSPVTIAPQTTVRGSLSFIIDTFSGGDDPFDLEVLRYYISGFVGKPEELFKFSLGLRM
ncbi:MAG: hypothetical protein E6G91_13615 [Alphaproteobacteria bacterium]|nr:MAG: hypothetical protein E6G91_13615 [Alphaproteobacteria bacterium]